MNADGLHRALVAVDDDLVLRPLPDEVAELLRALDAPPRLAAHLRAVHDVAVQLLHWLREQYPRLDVDCAAVLFGAATHDVGKVRYPDELSGPGSAHESEGYRLLLAHGVAEHLARFARDHARWDSPAATIEDLLVSLADKIWKGNRVSALEQRIVDRLCAASGQQPWEAFTSLDDALTRVAADAEARLAFQARYAS